MTADTEYKPSIRVMGKLNISVEELMIYPFVSRAVSVADLVPNCLLHLHVFRVQIEQSMRG